MSSHSPVPHEWARQLLNRELRHRRSDDLAAAAHAVFVQLHDSLAPAIGRTGYLMLASRALLTAKQEHAAMAGIQLGNGTENWLPGLTESIERHGQGAAAEGVLAMISAMIELLGRFVGETLAASLIALPETEEERNG